MFADNSDVVFADNSDVQRCCVGHSPDEEIKLWFVGFMDIRKALLIFLGTVCVGLGVLGMFLPLMPTTVFLLMAAYCYSKSSEKFHTWLLTNKLFGKYISDYKSGKGISLRQKVTTTIILWASIGLSIWMVSAGFWLTLLLVAIALGVTTHLFWLKTYKPSEEEVVDLPSVDTTAGHEV